MWPEFSNILYFTVERVCFIREDKLRAGKYELYIIERFCMELMSFPGQNIN